MRPAAGPTQQSKSLACAFLAGARPAQDQTVAPLYTSAGFITGERQGRDNLERGEAGRRFARLRDVAKVQGCMSLQYSTDLRDAMMDAIQYGAGETPGIGPSPIIRFWAGTLPANCAAADNGTLIAEIDLAESWADDAAAGMKAITCPLNANSIAIGTMTYFRLYASDGMTCHMQGTITEMGGGGDLCFDNTDVAIAQSFSVTTFVLTMPGA
jgi:hypothetical protein